MLATPYQRLDFLIITMEKRTVEFLFQAQRIHKPIEQATPNIEQQLVWSQI